MSNVRLDVEKLLNKKVVRQAGVKAATFAEASKRGTKASAVLAAHKHDGHSEIRVYSADVDAYIGLHDERGQMAAAAIEYGRDGYTREIPDKDGNVRTINVPPAKGVGALNSIMPGGLKRKRR